MDQRLAPYLNREQEPYIKHYFIGSARSWGTFMGGEAVYDRDVEAMIGLFNREILTGCANAAAGAPLSGI